MIQFDINRDKFVHLNGSLVNKCFVIACHVYTYTDRHIMLKIVIGTS